MTDAGSLRLQTDPQSAQRAFRDWLDILESGSDDSGPTWQLWGTDISFRRIGRHEPRLHTEFWVGSAASAALQINEPRTPATENGGSHVAIDKRGRRYILRQGDIHGNSELDRIKGLTFADRTGLSVADVRRGRKSATKQWHVVARLDGASQASIRAATADFVLRSWNARIYGAKAAEDQRRLGTLLGSPERGGWYDIEPDPTPRRVLRLQGYVYEDLEAVLSGSGVELSKPRHAAGYEVDGVIGASRRPALLEIKTGVSASDVYCGLGQLTIYPLILPDLSKLARILLLPGTPSPALVEAIGKANVELHSYEMERRARGRPRIRFSAKFLRRCGATA